MDLDLHRPADESLRPPPPLDLAGRALFLDLDGTLTPLVARPEAVGPDPRRAALLAKLEARLGGALAVVSGRGLDDLDRILEGRVAAVAAVHGLVRRTAEGQVIADSPGAHMAQASQELRAFAAKRPGVQIEDKRYAIAVHFRHAPDAEGAVTQLTRSLAGSLGLELQPGCKVVDLRLPGPDKGDALRAFCAEPPFAGRRPVFVGDDLTDEAGFAAARELRGFGVVVGCRRPTGAGFALADVPAALAWLSSAVGSGA